MSGSVNKVILIGRLGADPEIRNTQSGDPIANMRIATSEVWRDKQSGERKERTEWTTVVVFGKTAEIVRDYLKRGSQVCIEGQLQTRKWTDKNNAERYSTEVVVKPFKGSLTMLDSRDGGSAGGGSRQELDDEVPF